jgi:hypothetical protein
VGDGRVSDPVVIGLIVAIAIFLGRLGLVERREVRALQGRVDEFEDELERLRDDVESISPRPARDDLYDPNVAYGAIAERSRREAEE